MEIEIKIWCIGLAIYLLSAGLMWLWVYLTFSKGGKCHQTTDVGAVDLFFVFCPIINTVFSILLWLIDYPLVGRAINYKKFFRIK